MNRWWPMLVVSFGVFVAADDLMVVATMLRPMIDDFRLVIPADLDAASWIVNSYLVAYVAVIPVAGRLSDRFGRRAVFLAALALFALGSLIIPEADDLRTLYAGRVLSALGGGALVPVALAVAADLYRGPARVKALGVLAAIETVGWVWGPLYGAILVRLANWQWQFHINVALAVLGLVAGWVALDGGSRDRGRLDWLGPAALTAALVALCTALLSGAKVQSVAGLEQLTGDGGGRFGGPWLYGVAVVALVVFVATERRSPEPMVDHRLRRDRPALIALAINVLASVGLVVTLINVPMFVNIVVGDTRDSAVRAGWLLTAFTAAMALTSYLGGLWGASRGHRPPTAIGLALGTIGLAVMGLTWGPATSPGVMAGQLALAGAGIGLVLAPTNATVVDASGADRRGVASGLVIVARLIGFSAGLAALTAWGLRRYDQLRQGIELPPITAEGYADAVAAATVEVSTTALSETFLGGALALLVALALVAAQRSRPGSAVDRLQGVRQVGQ